MDKPARQTTQEKVMADIERRYTEALISEDYRECAEILVWLVKQVKGASGEIAVEHHANIREKARVLSDQLGHMSRAVAACVSEAVTIAEESVPDPRLDTALRKPLSDAESAAIREKYPPIGLKCSEGWDREWRPEKPHLNGDGLLNGNGSNGNGAQEPEVEEEEIDQPASYSEPARGMFLPIPGGIPCGPGVVWPHEPNPDYMPGVCPLGNSMGPPPGQKREKTESRTRENTKWHNEPEDFRIIL